MWLPYTYICIYICIYIYIYIYVLYIYIYIYILYNSFMLSPFYFLIMVYLSYSFCHVVGYVHLCFFIFIVLSNEFNSFTFSSVFFLIMVLAVMRTYKSVKDMLTCLKEFSFVTLLWKYSRQIKAKRFENPTCVTPTKIMGDIFLDYR